MSLRSTTAVAAAVFLSGCCNAGDSREAPPPVATSTSHEAPTARAALIWDKEDRASIAELAHRYATEPAPKADPSPAAAAPRAEPKAPVGSPARSPETSPSTGPGPIVGHPLPSTRFLDSSGEVVDLADWVGKKNVVLVVHRGFSGSVCMTCTSQTLAITQNLKAFADRDAQVLFVYPGTKDGVARFLEAVNDARGTDAALPVEVLLDTDLRLVHLLGIEDDLAKPTTLILDKSGVVRFEHVAPNISDRASVPTMLDALARLEPRK